MFHARRFYGSLTLTLLLVFGLTSFAIAQSRRDTPPRSDASPQKKTQRPADTAPQVSPTPAATNDTGDDADSSSSDGSANDRLQTNTVNEDEVVRTETNLVVVPVIVRNGDRYVADMRQDEFALTEDNVAQEIAFFAQVSEPFHVVLMLDTSASTQEKIRQMQTAAFRFTEQLQPADKVKIVSFDDAVRDLSEFTSDRETLRRAINTTRPGQGTKLYDAMQLAIRAFDRIKGRKAIVIFTDGVDYRSDSETFERNKRQLEEAGIIIYPIRYETRRDVEELVRQQQQGGQAVDLAAILMGRLPSAGNYPGDGRPQPSPTPRPTTTTTIPGTYPGGAPRLPTIPGLPGGVVIGGGSSRTGTIDTNSRYPTSRDDRSDPTSAQYPQSDDRATSGGSIMDAELDRLYHTGDEYLNELAKVTGGTLYRADVLGMLPAAFDQIAAELRTQYAIGYYPKNAARDGAFRKIKLRTTRKSVSLRARPGYRTRTATR